MTTSTKNTNKKLTNKGNKTMTTDTKTENPEVAEEKKITPYDMCVAMHAKNMDEDEMIEALAKHAGLSIIKAVFAYNKFKKKAGLVESKEDRTKRVHETIEDFVIMGEGDEPTTIDVKKAVEAVQDALDIGPQSARKHVKGYAKVNNIVIPEIERGIPATPEQVKFVVDSRTGGADKKTTLAEFISKWPETTENRAKNIYTKACKDAGLTKDNGAAHPNSEVIAWYKSEGVNAKDNKELRTLLETKFAGFSKFYYNRIMRQIAFALEFSK